MENNFDNNITENQNSGLFFENDECLIIFSKIENIHNKHIEKPIEKLQNVLIFDKQYSIKKSKNFKGNYFVLDIRDFLYAHFLFDRIAEYAYLKNYIPDLQIKFLSKDKITLDLIRKNLTEKDLSFVDEAINFYNEEILEYHDTVLSFENVFFIKNDYVHFPLQSFKTNGFIGLVSGTKESMERIKSLSKEFNKLKKEIKFSPKKIYISRSIANKTIKKELEEVINSNKPINRATLHRVNDRYYPIEYEKEIENFFFSNGYDIINLEGMGLDEQINLFYNATHVVTFAGTALLNSIFCKPGTKIFSINAILSYRFPLAHEIKHLDLEYYDVPNQSGNMIEEHFYGNVVNKIHYTEILNILEEHKNLLF